MSQIESRLVCDGEVGALSRKLIDTNGIGLAGLIDMHQHINSYQ